MNVIYFICLFDIYEKWFKPIRSDIYTTAEFFKKENRKPWKYRNRTNTDNYMPLE